VGGVQDADRDPTALFDRDFKCDIPDGAIGCDALAGCLGWCYRPASQKTDFPLESNSMRRQLTIARCLD
jgi:hypothetical protein